MSADACALIENRQHAILRHLQGIPVGVAGLGCISEGATWRTTHASSHPALLLLLYGPSSSSVGTGQARVSSSQHTWNDADASDDDDNNDVCVCVCVCVCVHACVRAFVSHDDNADDEAWSCCRRWHRHRVVGMKSQDSRAAMPHEHTPPR